jgi:RHS repeat-associated protein
LLGRSHGYSSGNWSTHNFYHADGNGNVTYLVNSSQTLSASYRYDPYGNTISSSGSLASANVYRFSSKEMHDASGHYYYGYRWYAPNLQRWLNRDPIGEPGFQVLRRALPQVTAIASSSGRWMGGDRPDNENRYLCVGNSPVNHVDPLGLIKFEGCEGKEAGLQEQFNNFCQKVKGPAVC